MKVLKISLFLFSIFLFSNTSLQAQTTPQGWLNAVQQQIQECKEDIKLVESMLSSIEGVNNSLTIPTRKKWQARLAANKECLEKAQKELDALKRDYPALFNPPNTNADMKPEEDRQHRAMQRLMQEILEAHMDALNQHNNLQKLMDDLMKDD